MLPVPFDQLATADLTVERVYQGGSAGNWADDPLAQLLPVGNQGGFRTNGSPAKDEVRLAVLFTSGAEPDWPDVLDVYTGSFTYYGDNRSPGGNCMTRRAGATCCCARSSSGLTMEHRAVPGFRRSSCSTSPGGGGTYGSADCWRWLKPAERRGRPCCGVADNSGPAVPELPRPVHRSRCRVCTPDLDRTDPRPVTRWAVHVLRRGGPGCSPVPTGHCWLRPR